MAKGIYVGVDNIARKVKKLYFGVDGVARKVTKGYIGVDGVARPFFSGEKKLVYYGTTTGLSEARVEISTATVGNYALFAGGLTSTSSSGITTQTPKSNVDTYDINLVKGTATNLYASVYRLASASMGNYALFGGGGMSTTTKNSYITGKLRAYDANLVTSTPSDLSVARRDLSATAVGNYALFGGGFYDAEYRAEVQSYNSNLVRGNATALSVGRMNLKATTVGNYALFAGGNTGSGSRVVDSYDINLVKGTPTDLGASMTYHTATTIGEYALFAGGATYTTTSSTKLNRVVAYNANLVRSLATTLSVARRQLASTSIGNYALFGGGYGSSSVANVDTYDINLVKGTTDDLSAGRSQLASVTIGNYALFSGSSTNNVMDVYALV